MHFAYADKLRALLPMKIKFEPIGIVRTQGFLYKVRTQQKIIWQPCDKVKFVSAVGKLQQ